MIMQLQIFKVKAVKSSMTNLLVILFQGLPFIFIKNKRNILWAQVNFHVQPLQNVARHTLLFAVNPFPTSWYL